MGEKKIRMYWEVNILFYCQSKASPNPKKKKKK